ncbi:thiamine kinase-like enzyme [Lachnospiraceae bacterium PF1-21]|uniref:Phosphotransferase family protein n=1 Tax=Ohessyouella blattaphilus TaxID=2949333 RepID=A0ABT1EH15_9FIRM|nr:choline/ethanolamine kinase family protein [Ohessyouella blattaphilus]MCP1109988.1 phosphotransferase family protein [Ohessyouella blattaphilus]MCR8563382.1 phosphotransferase family protein [Ohessyouella blattaphilus]MDL2250903.1 phosphotransferase family protein [Lachnospiraceae bacterium OttesenSCG-928-J05]
MLVEKERKAIRQTIAEVGMLDDNCEIQKIDAGMTNHLYTFYFEGLRYLIRIPGAGTEYLVNRKQEANVYEQLCGRGIADELIYINPGSGIKITKFLDNSHICDIKNPEETKACMLHLRQFHELKLKVDHDFDVFKKIGEYEKQCHEPMQNLNDYENIRSKILELESMIEQMEKEYCLCHIDAISDNFLIKEKEVYLVDWEYAAMCDPDIDIAMFCIYAEYDKANTDRIIDEYHETKCSEVIRKKIYAYMAAGAFLWVLWSEVKRLSGADHEGYKQRQYRIAKEFYEYAAN